MWTDVARIDYASNLLVVDITHRYESIFYPKPVGT
jgi:hypothetical protein